MQKILFVVLVSSILLFPASAKAREPLSITVSGQRVDTDPYSLINEVNALRTVNGLAAYSINPILMSTAQAQANYMAATGVVSHFGPGGSTQPQRLLAAGYPLAGNLALGGLRSENITAGHNKSVQQAVQEWQGDAPHLNTMLSPNLREIGAGVAFVGEYVYYVIDCATPTSSGQQQSYTPAPGTTQVADESYFAPLASTIVPNTPGVDGKLIHEVRPGETLWLIAISYGVKVADIRRLNNMAEADAIYPSERLLIRLESTPAPTVASTATVTLTPEIPLLATLTLLPLSPTASVTSTPTKMEEADVLPGPPVSSSSSGIVLVVIIVAALALAVVLVRMGRKI